MHNKQQHLVFHPHQGTQQHQAHLSKVLLHKFAAHNTDERCSGVVRHCLGEHGLARARRSVEEHAARGVDANLPVKVAMGEGQLNSLANLLLLNVEPANVLRVEVMQGWLIVVRKTRQPGSTWYVTSGRSDWLSMEMLESASGGRMSTSALLWRCSATLWQGDGALQVCGHR